MSSLKLFMLLLGCKPPGRHVEQHDIFFGIAPTLDDLVPDIQAHWPEPEKIHVDAWREVNFVDAFQIVIRPRKPDTAPMKMDNRLFFINLGGYQENKFEEQHYVVLTVRESREQAILSSKDTLFFQQNHFPGANSHIDDKYGIDVDDIYEIEEMLSAAQKEKYRIGIIPAEKPGTDPIHLGYFKLNRPNFGQTNKP